MKACMKNPVLALVVSVAILSVPSLKVFSSEPLLDTALSVAAGNVYRKVGETELRIGNRFQMLAIYKADHKPFLIIGPCRFYEDGDYEDFFFVNRDQVIRTATDKGGDMWCRVFDRLYIIDDLSDCEILRSPHWDDLKCDKNSSIRYDQVAKMYIYSFKISDFSVPVSFAIPAELFTPDMLDAPNRTRVDRQERARCCGRSSAAPSTNAELHVRPRSNEPTFARRFRRVLRVR